MIQVGMVGAGGFCWVDLAASDAARAKRFYSDLFGWQARDQPANGGSFTRLRQPGRDGGEGRDVGSLYQLRRAHLEQGIPSHWTPYVRVADVEEATRLAVVLGGSVIVNPLVIDGVARIALIRDAVGAPVGLWQAIDGGRAAGVAAND